MGNPHEGLIKFIDLLLNRMELYPDNGVYLFSKRELPDIKMDIKDIFHPSPELEYVQKLQNNGAIGNWEFTKDGISIADPDSKLLLKERQRLENFYASSTRKTTPKTKHKSIVKITVVKPNDGERYRIFINDIPTMAFEVSKRKGYWKTFYQIVEGNYPTEDDEIRKTRNYFNSDVRGKLYTHNKLKSPQAILKQEDRALIPAVEVEMITEKQYQNKLKKLTA